MATEKFSKWCTKCYSYFTDPVKYEQHIAVCGKPSTEATEPVKTSNVNTNTDAKGREEVDGVIVPEDVSKSTDANETLPEPKPETVNVPVPSTEATEPVKTQSRSKAKTK